MIDSRVRELIKIAKGQFDNRGNLLSYWQELAEHFYPERADFTLKRFLGDDLETGLMTSTPVLARRELGNMISTVLRPPTPWNKLVVDDETINEQHDNRAWLEWATRVQRKAMYDPAAQFIRATKEGDHDWVTFGNAVISIDVNYETTSLLYRSWHLRDCAWSESVGGDVDTMNLKWKPTIRQLAQKFPKTIDQRLLTRKKDDPECKIHCLRIVCPREDWDTSEGRKANPGAKWMSFYIDEENETLLEDVAVNYFNFVVPRWARISGTPYAWSQATGPGLADARTLQAVTRILLEAGEKAVDPPMIATMEAVRSDVNIMAGGITWVDIEYDEKLGEALRPLSQNLNIPAGIELADRLVQANANGMFLNKLNLPDLGDMTAYEVRKRIEQMVRQTMPLFEPASQDYNAPMCERTFEILMHLKTFGPAESIPDGLRGKDIRFTFTSPLTDLEDEGNAQKALQGAQILQTITTLDPAQRARVNVDKIAPAALKGAGWPEDWLNDQKAVDAQREQDAQTQAAEQAAGALAAGAPAAKDAATAAATLSQAGLLDG